MVILPFLFAISLGRNNNVHPNTSGISYGSVGIIPAISQQCFRRYSVNQVNRFFAINSGTLF